MDASTPDASAPSKTGVYLRCAWRLLVFICLVIILCFYVPVIAAESVNEVALSRQWVYVLVLVGISAVVMVADFFLAPYKLFAVHMVLTILWLAAFGVFAQMFTGRSGKRHDEFAFTDDKKVNMRFVDTGKMKVGVWVLFSMTFLWAVYGAYTTLRFIKGREKRKTKHAEWYRMESQPSG